MLFSELITLAQKAEVLVNFKNPTNKDFIIADFCVDTRNIKENSLFICLKGEKSDGHTHIPDAINKNAIALLAEKGKLENFSEIPVIYVENTYTALQKIAHTKRMDFAGKVIAITGSAGKTNVKEILAQVLNHKGKTAKNYLNFNTQIGVSLSILNTQNDEDFWVLEAGISHEHDMDEIGEILTPDIALVLNVGLAHSEGLPKGVAYYKSKLFSYLKNSSSLALASADYPELLEESKKLHFKTLYFSIKDEENKYFASYKGISSTGKGLYSLRIRDTFFEIETPLRSSYGAENCLAIALIALSCGMTTEEIQIAFKDISLPPQRFEKYIWGSTILIDDSYNANPLSFMRMIEAAYEYCIPTSENSFSRPFICLAGSMKELGDIAPEEHKKLGQKLAIAQSIFYTGEYVKEIKEGLNEQNFSGDFSLLTSPEDFAQTLKNIALKDAVFFVKGSRSHRLELYSAEIKKYYG